MSLSLIVVMRQVISFCHLHTAEIEGSKRVQKVTFLVVFMLHSHRRGHFSSHIFGEFLLPDGAWPVLSDPGFKSWLTLLIPGCDIVMPLSERSSTQGR